jgi:hypothetical protein
MTILFKAGRLIGLDFLPHDSAFDGVKGVVETNTPTLAAEDCVALAGGMAGEIVGLGSYDPARLLDDRQQIGRLAGEPLEMFAPEAYRIILENSAFFKLLHAEVRIKMLAVLSGAFSLSEFDYERLPARVPIITLAEVQRIYARTEGQA